MGPLKHAWEYAPLSNSTTSFLTKITLEEPFFFLSDPSTLYICLTLLNIWIFSLLSTTQESVRGIWFTAWLCDSESRSTVRAAAAAAGDRGCSKHTKGTEPDKWFTCTGAFCPSQHLSPASGLWGQCCKSKLKAFDSLGKLKECAGSDWACSNT